MSVHLTRYDKPYCMAIYIYIGSEVISGQLPCLLKLPDEASSEDLGDRDQGSLTGNILSER
jgi:hypothetical protein